MTKLWKLQLFVPALIAGLVWIAVFQIPDSKLRIVTCDVGQGDSILITYESTQILIDGGPGRKVLDCLSRYLPFWDRDIELVMLTHPQEDHYLGLIEVFKLYKVDTFLATSLDSGNQSYQVLKNEVGGSQARVVNPVKGQSMGLGMIHLDILSPSEDFLTSNMAINEKVVSEGKDGGKKVLGSHISRLDPNEFSIVARLSYRHFEALFTGDASRSVSDMVSEDFVGRDVSMVKYIKIPHHGSKNALSESLLEKYKPDVAVISVGKNNSYGHPNGEVIKSLRDRDIKILRTDEMGDVVVETDGYNPNLRVRPLR